MNLTPFSYVILVLVGRDGAGPHDLRRMADNGRVYWDAAPSQWYAEPKRLAADGLLEARQAARPDPGAHALHAHGEGSPRARGVGQDAGPAPPRPERAGGAADGRRPRRPRRGARGPRSDARGDRGALEQVARAREVVQPELPHRAHLLEVNHRYAERLLELQAEWLEEAERVLRAADLATPAAGARPALRPRRAACPRPRPRRRWRRPRGAARRRGRCPRSARRAPCPRARSRTSCRSRPPGGGGR